MDLIGGPKLSKMFATIRTAVYGIRTTRDFPAAGDTASQTVVSAVYAILPGANSNFDLNGAPGISMRVVLNDGTTAANRIAVKFYGSVDGTNFVDVHELLTGSPDPIVNDYGAVDKVYQFPLGIRNIAPYAMYTAGGATGTCRVYWQPKFDTVADSQSNLLKKFIDACADLSRGNVGARVDNWPSNNIVPYNFFDNGGVATGVTAGTYLPSSTGMSLAGIDSLSITGDLTAGAADTVTVTFEVCNDEDTATTGNWKQIYFLNDLTGATANSLTVSNADLDFAIPWRAIGTYANIRIKLVVAGGLSNTIIIKGNGKGA